MGRHLPIVEDAEVLRFTIDVDGSDRETGALAVRVVDVGEGGPRRFPGSAIHGDRRRDIGVDRVLARLPDERRGSHVATA